MDFQTVMTATSRIERISKSYMDFDAKIRRITDGKMGFTEYNCFDDIWKEMSIPDCLKHIVEDRQELLNYYCLVQIHFQGQFIVIARALKALKCSLTWKIKSAKNTGKECITSIVLESRRIFLNVCRNLLSAVRDNFHHLEDLYHSINRRAQK